MFSDIFLVETALLMFLSQYRNTKAIFYLFYKITKIFQIFVTSFMSLYFKTKRKCSQRISVL